MVNLPRTLTFRRYRVVGDRPDVMSPAFLEGVVRNRFRPLGVAIDELESAGWVSPLHIFDTDFSVSKLLRGSHVMFALRIDRRKVPANLRRALVEMEEQAYRAEHDAERVPFAARREIRERVREKLTRETPPAVNAYGCIWNLKTQAVYFLCLGERVNDKFRTLFHASFGMELIPVDPAVCARESAKNAAARSRLDHLLPSRFAVTEGGKR